MKIKRKNVHILLAAVPTLYSLRTMRLAVDTSRR